MYFFFLFSGKVQCTAVVMVIVQILTLIHLLNCPHITNDFRIRNYDNKLSPFWTATSVLWAFCIQVTGGLSKEVLLFLLGVNTCKFLLTASDIQSLQQALHDSDKKAHTYMKRYSRVQVSNLIPHYQKPTKYFITKVFSGEIRQISCGFHMKSSRFHVDFRWNLVDFMQISWNLADFVRISWNPQRKTNNCQEW